MSVYIHKYTHSYTTYIRRYTHARICEYLCMYVCKYVCIQILWRFSLQNGGTRRQNLRLLGYMKKVTTYRPTYIHSHTHTASVCTAAAHAHAYAHTNFISSTTQAAAQFGNSATNTDYDTLTKTTGACREGTHFVQCTPSYSTCSIFTHIFNIHTYIHAFRVFGGRELLQLAQHRRSERRLISYVQSLEYEVQRGLLRDIEGLVQERGLKL